MTRDRRSKKFSCSGRCFNDLPVSFHSSSFQVSRHNFKGKEIISHMVYVQNDFTNSRWCRGVEKSKKRRKTNWLKNKEEVIKAKDNSNNVATKRDKVLRECLHGSVHVEMKYFNFNVFPHRIAWVKRGK